MVTEFELTNTGNDRGQLGIKRVQGEFTLTFLAYNLKRAINIVGAKNESKLCSRLSAVQSYDTIK